MDDQFRIRREGPIKNRVRNNPSLSERPYAAKTVSTMNDARQIDYAKLRSKPATQELHPKLEYKSGRQRNNVDAVINTRPDLPKQMRSGVLKRHIVSPVASVKHKRSRRHIQPKPKFIMAAAILIFIIGGFIIFNSLRLNKSVKNQVAQLTQEANQQATLGITDAVPSEALSEDDISTYSVAADLPRTISIKKINIEARVQQIGFTRDNMLKSPSNIFDAGWYQNSSKPGEPGAVVIGGHISGPTKSGIFYSMGSLKPGDKISLERGDGKAFNYTVIDRQHYDNDKVDMAKLMASIMPSKPGLNLVTSSSRFNITTNQYEQRIVVFAVQD